MSGIVEVALFWVATGCLALYTLYKLVRLVAYSRYQKLPQETHAFYLNYGNNIPVEQEVTAKSLPVVGTMPADLDGVFLRTGPNPKFPVINEEQYGWFDGDGHIHGIQVAHDAQSKEALVSYSNRWVETSKLLQEEEVNKAIFPNPAGSHGWVGFYELAKESIAESSGKVDISKKLATGSLGRGNTALLYHHNKLYGLYEGDAPYGLQVLCHAAIQTLEWETNGLSFPFTAHPKIDAVNGECVFFGAQSTAKPYLTMGVMSADGTVTRTVPVTDIAQPKFIHDFAITTHFMVIMDLPLTFDFNNPLKHPVNGESILFKPEIGARLGLLPRTEIGQQALGLDSMNKLKWFDLPSACFVFHVFNAFEVSQTRSATADPEAALPTAVRLLACRMANIDMAIMRDPSYFKDDMVMEVFQFDLDITTGKAAQTTVAKGTYGEFPMVNPRTVSIKSQYGYMASYIPQPGTTWWSGGEFPRVVKIDFDSGKMVGEVAFADCIPRKSADGVVSGGECRFVPKQPSAGAAEDDGYLLTYVHDEAVNISYFVVIDAKNMLPMASVQLPQRVPYGFHTTYLTKTELDVLKGVVST
ncbi:hypothetical protein CYMTET_20867 [Cymbomonas tetramitiformis]|uniref:carotenoid 9,10-dioxygenase n=1 Tax=Cymbomonas tetramitiformis TaxID=36881 RepID=A0AAE0G3Y4_9CHLO|nr:hypothetical protein CYMTET_20867 [Cymbomonas tetramitiformis]